MKNNWQTKKLSELCEVFADGDWIEKKDQSQSGIRLIQTGNVGEGHFKDRAEKARYISEKTFNRLNCTEILPGDCLISRLPDPVGRACIIPKTGEKMITAVDCTIIRFKREVIPGWFLHYSLSQEYQDQIDKEVGGATRQRISRKNLGQIEIPLPLLADQKRITEILDRVLSEAGTVKENAAKNLKNSGLWGLFYETSKAANYSFQKIHAITEENFGKEAADKVSAAKKLSFRGSVPAVIYSVLSLVVLLVIVLIWRK